MKYILTQQLKIHQLHGFFLNNYKNKQKIRSYTKQNLNGKIQALTQTSLIECSPSAECTASLIMLKHKDWYDSEISVNMLMRTDGITGIAFRVRDAFNYYAFEMSKKEKFKRIRRVMDGISHTICEKKDGGFIENEWIRVKNDF